MSSNSCFGDAANEFHDNPEERPQVPSDEEQPKPPPAKPRRPRGFAAMDRRRVSEIASKGGKAAHHAGTAHEFTSDEARSAGRKGDGSARATWIGGGRQALRLSAAGSGDAAALD